ncbi:hypothetical protein HZP59_08935 [Elizabethkingia anophelis]|nr:hypothetical protein [Elizabethkingia anophelis]
MKQLKIEIPEGFKVDEFNPESGIIKFKPIPQNIKDRIKTLDDVYNYHGIDKDELNIIFKYCSEDEIAYKHLKLITSALNEGWTPDWSNWDERKYYPWFEMSDSSGRFSFNDSHDLCSFSCCASRLCFKSKEIAEYAAKQFLKVYEKYMVIK